MIAFTGKLCLAPMVRSGELPMRLASLRNGADIVWTPELVDKKLIQTTRIINPKINTIDYIHHNENQKPTHKDTVVFRTFPREEQGKLILQLGSADPDLAVKASLKVIQDVEGIDLNCGCPKNFSVHSGMGAALLSTPDLLCSILRNLVDKIGIPYKKSISCKIRLLDDFESTKSLIDKICQTGINNLTIHCRQRHMRNRQDIIWNYLPTLIPYIQGKGISVVINGGLLSYQDFKHLQAVIGNEQIGGMIAESAETNYSVFNQDHSPRMQYRNVIEFFKICQAFNYDGFANSKYMLLNQIPGKSPFYAKIAKCKSFGDVEMTLNDEEVLESDKHLSKIYIKDLQMNKFFNNSEEFNSYLDDRRDRWIQQFKQFRASESVIEPIIIDPRKRPPVATIATKRKNSTSALPELFKRNKPSDTATAVTTTTAAATTTTSQSVVNG